MTSEAGLTVAEGRKTPMSLSDQQAASSSVDVVEAIKAQHQQSAYGDWCRLDQQPWPCGFGSVLAALERAKQEIAERDKEIERLKTQRNRLANTVSDFLDEWATVPRRWVDPYMLGRVHSMREALIVIEYEPASGQAQRGQGQ